MKTNKAIALSIFLTLGSFFLLLVGFFLFWKPLDFKRADS